MKTWMKVVLGGLAGVSLLVGLMFWLTGDITRAGNDFFAAVQKKDIDSAYALLSEDFQADVTKEELRSYLDANALNNIIETSWSSRSVTGNKGELEGTVTTAQGSMIPLKLRLIKSKTGWLINAIEKENSGFTDHSNSSKEGSLSRTEPNQIIPSLPPVEDQIRLVKDTTNTFVKALTEKDMQLLHDQGSKKFRNVNSAESLMSTFADFKMHQQEMMLLEETTPGLRNPVRQDRFGRMIVEGYHEMKSKVLIFDYFYELEDSKWKIDEIGIGVEPRKPN